MNDAEEKAEEKRKLGESICHALQGELDKLGLSEKPTMPKWACARFSLHRDPALGMESLEALWLGGNGEKLGSATLHDDGSFYAEYDVIQPHPHKAKWFVEAVVTWGNTGVLKSEARLLPMPE